VADDSGAVASHKDASPGVGDVDRLLAKAEDALLLGCGNGVEHLGESVAGLAVADETVVMLADDVKEIKDGRGVVTEEASGVHRSLQTVSGGRGSVSEAH
jgi:hypothetical protein